VLISFTFFDFFLTGSCDVMPPSIAFLDSFFLGILIVTFSGGFFISVTPVDFFATFFSGSNPSLFLDAFFS